MPRTCLWSSRGADAELAPPRAFYGRSGGLGGRREGVRLPVASDGDGHLLTSGFYSDLKDAPVETAHPHQSHPRLGAPHEPWPLPTHPSLEPWFARP
jgi:hypothetical protein